MIAGVRVLNTGTIGKANKGAPPSYASLQIEPGMKVEWHVIRI